LGKKWFAFSKMQIKASDLLKNICWNVLSYHQPFGV